MNLRPLRVLLLLGLCLCSAQAETPTAEVTLADQTVVIYNPAFEGSQALAEYYAKRRGIPKERLVGLKCPVKESLSREEYNKLIKEPLRLAFSSRGWWKAEERTTKSTPQNKSGKTLLVTSSNIRFLAIIRGVPYQIRRSGQNPKPMQEDEASVDSELMMLGMPDQGLTGALRNPYYNHPARFEMFQASPGFLLAGRLDGPDDATVQRMVDDALTAEEKGLRGRAVIDLALKKGAYEEGEEWLRVTTKQFRDGGVPVYVEATESLLRENWPIPDTVFYFGWYTTDITGAFKSPNFRFKTGAIACHLHSFSATHLRSTQYGWAGPLLGQGAAATLGNVYEPYLALTTHFDLFTKKLLDGFTLAEAAWNATPVVSWMNVVLGDPLYRPYRQGIGASLGEGKERDYALYQGAVRRSVGGDSRKLKSTLVRLADSRGNARLLELTGLYSILESKTEEARELLEHAGALYTEPEDQLRTVLYRAQLLVREGNAKAAVQLLRTSTQNASFKELPAFLAALALLRDLGG